MEEATGAPSSFADSGPKRLRASGRDGGSVMTRPPLPLTMLLSRHTKRREFITLLGGAAAAWPLRGARAAAGDAGDRIREQPFDRDSARSAAAFRKGLNETGYVQGQNVMVEYHWLEGHDCLPSLPWPILCGVRWR